MENVFPCSVFVIAIVMSVVCTSQEDQLSRQCGGTGANLHCNILGIALSLALLRLVLQGVVRAVIFVYPVVQIKVYVADKVEAAEAEIHVYQQVQRLIEFVA